MFPSLLGDAFWPAFLAVVAALWLADFVFFRQAYLKGRRVRAVTANLAWLGAAALLIGALALREGAEAGAALGAGFFASKALTAGEVFILYLVLRALRIPDVVGRRVLFAAFVAGSLARVAAVALGYALAPLSAAVPIGVGLVTLFMAAQFLLRTDRPQDVTGHWAVRLVRRAYPFSEQMPPRRLWVVEDGRRKGTPLLLTAAVFAFSIAVFAVTAFAAAYAVTPDQRIGLAGALLGLAGFRSMYFVIAGWAHVLRRVKPGLTLSFGYAGAATLLTPWYRIEPAVSLLILGLVWMSALASTWYTAHEPQARRPIR